MVFDESRAKRVEFHIPMAVVPYGDTENFSAYLNHALKSTRRHYAIDRLTIHYTQELQARLVIVADDFTADLLVSALKTALFYAADNAHQGPDFLETIERRRRGKRKPPPWQEDLWDEEDEEEDFPRRRWA